MEQQFLQLRKEAGECPGICYITLGELIGVG